MALLVLVTLAGCGEDTPARSAGPDTPAACWQRFQEAVAGRDYAAIYHLLSSKDHEYIAAELKQLHEAEPNAQAAAAEKLGLSLDQFKSLAPEQYFIHLLAAASKDSPADKLSGATLVEIEQQRAFAKLTVRLPDGSTIPVPCVREELAGSAGQQFGWFMAIYAR